MKISGSFPVLAALAFALTSCSSTSLPGSSSIPNLGEAKASSAIRQFLSTLDKSIVSPYDNVAYRNLKLVSTGPIIIDGSKRRVPFRLSADTVVTLPATPVTKEFDDSFAVFEPGEDGTWYLTMIQYLGEAGAPNIEAK